MGQLILDTNDDVGVLRAGRNMLNELLGETQAAAPDVIATRPDAGGEAEETPPGPGTDIAQAETRVDPNGVVFDPEFCGNAAKPFYGSGKREGQWKKRQGISEADYNTWYAGQLAAVAVEETVEEEEIDTAGAFGSGGAGEPAGDPAPEDCGAFMGWVSAKQAAGLLTQEDIGDAYSAANNGEGITVMDLFPPNDGDEVKARVAELYRILVVKGGA